MTSADMLTRPVVNNQPHLLAVLDDPAAHFEYLKHNHAVLHADRVEVGLVDHRQQEPFHLTENNI